MLSDEQIRVYLDEPLDPAAREALEEKIAKDPEALRKILDHRRIEQGLRVLLGRPEEQDRVKQSVLAVLEGPSPDALRNMVLRDTKIDPDAVRRGNRAVVWSAIALAACVAAAALVLNQFQFTPKPGPGPQTVAQLEQIEGAVTVSRRVGAPLTATNAFALRPGDTIAVPREGSATIQYPDGTALHLSGDTRVTLSAAPATANDVVTMETGDMNASVGASAANRPLIVTTPQGTVTAGQGQIQVSASSNSTQLNVNTGTARIAQPGTQQSADVTAGQFLVARPGFLFQPQPIQPHTNYWQPTQTNGPQIVPPQNNNRSPEYNNNIHPGPPMQRPGSYGPPHPPSNYQPQYQPQRLPSGRPSAPNSTRRMGPGVSTSAP